MDNLFHDSLANLLRETRAARERTARVNRGLTQAMVNGEDLIETYERLKNEELEKEDKDENRPQEDDSSGLPRGTEEGAGEGEPTEDGTGG